MQQQQEQVQEKKAAKYFLISYSADGETWQPDELVEHTPVPRVRQLLGGRWEKSSQYTDYARAYFNGPRRALVLSFPEGKTREDAEKALKEIHAGREENN